MMKKFTRILICLILCVFGVGLIGCKDNRTPEEKAFTYPTRNDVVSSNGGLAVRKGNYIYFANGYQSATSSERDGSYLRGGILLAKLSKTGELVVDENGAIDDDYYIHMSNKLSGFEATDLTIIGDYLYFTSVCQEDDAETEEWANTLVDFNRIKLDKSSEVEKIYESTSSNSNVKFKYYENNGSVSLVVFEKDDNKLVKVSVGGETSSIEKVQSVNFAENYDELFYVCSTESETLKYEVKKFNAVSGESSNFFASKSNVSVEFVENGKAYILENDNLTSYNISSKTLSGLELGGFSTYSSVEIAEDGTLVAVSTEGNGVIFEFFVDAEPKNYVLDSSTTEANIIGFTQGFVVYRDKDNNIKTIGYNSYSDPVTVAKISDLNTSYFDIEDSFVYFFKKVGENEYLHRLRVDAGAQVEEFVGVYLEADIPESEE